MQMNPMLMNFMQLMKSGGNPQQLVMNMLSAQAENNPMMANLLQLAQKGDSANIEQIARNMLKSQGLDFDKEFGEFQALFNSK